MLQERRGNVEASYQQPKWDTFWNVIGTFLQRFCGTLRERGCNDAATLLLLKFLPLTFTFSFVNIIPKYKCWHTRLRTHQLYSMCYIAMLQFLFLTKYVRRFGINMIFLRFYVTFKGKYMCRSKFFVNLWVVLRKIIKRL